MSNTPDTAPEITAATTMAELLTAFPGAQRALFARYHIGGCQSCGFQPGETLAELCARNENLPVDEVIDHVRSSHQQDSRILVSPEEIAGLGDDTRFLDTRTREEFDAVKLPGAQLLSQELIQTIFTSWDKETTLVVYDHTGTRCLDAATYLIGHGFANTRALEGGIDAYAKNVDKSLPRYRVEYED